ncbi:hypothetical protein HME9302_02270 [Alteripontixanthobacter maritimus]|uniref:Uncharacterized protein n=1 Tax=Alteripontixanthobacter maritimus TaxID=2161824 RepID=A0A369Q837_9SPHN|nr:biopolymer transporter ExbD [Alteripontixanthobacter maritimus]RDC61053.1 hypothetical protein HME9302_02270 [Alteripontixanthobacter maritimus]
MTATASSRVPIDPCRRDLFANYIEPFDHGEPIWRPNFAPIAGVLMIVGILFFAAWPVQTHALLIDLPFPGYDGEAPHSDMPVYTITIMPTGTIYVDGNVAPLNALPKRLETIASLPTEAGIIFAPADNTATSQWLPVLAVIKTAGLASWQFCFGGTTANQRYEALDGKTTAATPKECNPRTNYRPDLHW